MRDHKAKLMLLPFSMGCGSKSSVAVGKNNQQPKEQKHKRSAPKILFPPPTSKRKEGKKESKSRSKERNIRAFLVVSEGVNRLIKRFKRFSQLLVYKDEEEEVETEMEIGLPTDVKHITHIGLDGSTAINPTKTWENVEPSEILSLSSISLKQFELAMAAQAGAQPLSVGCTK